MPNGSPFGNHQLVGDLTVAIPERDERHYFALARGERTL